MKIEQSTQLDTSISKEQLKELAFATVSKTKSSFLNLIHYLIMWKKILNQKKRLINKYTNYASTVEVIINDSCDVSSATNIIVKEAQSQNIEDVKINTELVFCSRTLNK